MGSTPDRNPTARRAKREAIEIEPAVKEEWTKFPDLPGTHLSMYRVGRHSREVVTSDGLVSASYDGHGFSFTDLKSAVHVGGRKYRWLQIRKGLKRDVALKAMGAIIKRIDDSRALVDWNTNEQALRVTGHHFNRSANTQVTLPDQTTIKLPV